MTMWRTLSVRVLPQAHCILHVDEAGVFAQLPVRVVGDPPLPVIGINHFPGRQEREVDSGSNKTWKQWRGNVIRKETGETWSDRLDLSLCQVYKRGIYKNWMSIDKLRMEIIVEAVSHDFLDVYTVICNLIFTNYLRVIIFISLFGWITNCPKYDFFFFHFVWSVSSTKQHWGQWQCYSSDFLLSSISVSLSVWALLEQEWVGKLCSHSHTHHNIPCYVI